VTARHPSPRVVEQGTNVPSAEPGSARSTRRKRPVRWLGAAIAVLLSTQAASYLAWENLAGEYLVLRPAQSHNGTSPALTAAPGTQAPSLGRVRRPSPAHARPQSNASRDSPATVMDGTAAAVVMVLLINGAAYLALRLLIRRRRSQDRRCVEEPAAEPPTTRGEPYLGELPAPESSASSLAIALVDQAAPAAVADGSDAALAPPGEQRRSGLLRPRSLMADEVTPEVGHGRAATWNGSIVLFDASEATRVPYASLVHLEWHDHQICASTSHVSLRDVSCLIPERCHTPLPDATTPVRVTLQLGGNWTTLTTRLTRHHSTPDGQEVVLALVEVEEKDRKALLHITRNRVAR
jgi:hypothetical protein